MYGFVGVVVIAIGVALAALIGSVLLGRTVVRNGGPRTSLWLILLVLMTVITVVAAQLAMVFYRLPIAWVVGLVVIVAATAALFVRVGMDVKWKTGAVVATVGVLVTASVALMAVMMVVPLGNAMVPLFETRAQQIGEAAGFTALLPTDEPMFTEYLPVDRLTGADEGLTVLYQRFEIQERKAAGPLGESDLRTILGPGSKPLGINGPGIPEDARYTVLEVGGSPALGVEYVLQAEKAVGGIGPETIHVLAFESDGVEVRMLARNGADYQADGSYEPYSALSLDRLAEIAETLAPIER